MKYERIDIRVEGSLEEAYLQVYSLEDSEEYKYGSKRPMVIICPGGAYRMTSDREAEPVAMKYLAEGFHAAVLRYSVAPARYPAALLELTKTISYFRNNAEYYHIDNERIFLQGFSAGGHLVASYGTMWHKEFIRQKLGVSLEELRPNAMILAYPVITSGTFAHEESIRNLLGDRYEELREEMSLEKQVNEHTPPAFLWHTMTDPSVAVENTLLFVQSLCQKKIVSEVHIYPIGDHGLSLANELTESKSGQGLQKECEGWFDLAVKFLRRC